MYSNYFIEQLRARPAADTALVEPGGRRISCGELFRESVQLATNLAAAGMVPGSRVVVAAAPGVEFLCVIYAAMLLRTQVAIIDPEMGRENYRSKLGQFDPQWAFADYRLLLLQEHPLLRWLYFRHRPQGPYLPARKGVKTVATGNWMPIFQPHLSAWQLRKKTNPHTHDLHLETPSNDLPPFLLVTYTSGTLAEPKGVVHTLDSLAKSIRLLADLLAGVPQQRIATHAPHYALIGVNAGIPVYLWDQTLSPMARIRFIEQRAITTLFGPPVDYRVLLQTSASLLRALPDCLRLLLIGSAPVHTAFLENLYPALPRTCQVLALYGMTENLLVAVARGSEKLQRHIQGDWLGYPVEGVECRLAPDGEILLRSPQLFHGYLGMPSRDTWHPTGDLGRIEQDGSLTLTGRKKDMIIRRHFNLYPALYEPTINKIPGVSEAVLIGIYDEDRHDEIVCLVVETERPLTEIFIRNCLTRGAWQIDREAQPDLIAFRILPRKGRQFKVDRGALRQWLAREWPLVDTTVSKPLLNP